MYGFGLRLRPLGSAISTVQGLFRAQSGFFLGLGLCAGLGFGCFACSFFRGVFGYRSRSDGTRRLGFRIGEAFE